MKKKFPNSMEYSSNLALEYLKRRQYSKAITELSHIVERWPSQKSSKEKVLLQLALKWTEMSTTDELKTIIKTCSTLSEIAQTVKELAEGYQRAGHLKEATFLYQEGATSGLFVSTWQRMIIDNDLFIQGEQSLKITKIVSFEFFTPSKWHNFSTLSKSLKPKNSRKFEISPNQFDEIFCPKMPKIFFSILTF